MNSFYLAFLLLTCLVVTGCSDDDDTAPQAPISEELLTYLALGDSYTIGTGVRAEVRWPTQLVNAIERDTDLRFGEVRYVAQNGWRTDDLRAGIERTTLRERYDLVSLLIGVNNQFQGRSVAAYEADFRELLDRAITFADGRPERVFVVSIPDYAFTPFGQGRAGISADIDRFNAAARAITEAAGVMFYNITPISREGLAMPQLVADDDLHPSGEQYGRWVEEVLLEPVIAQLRR